MGRFGEKRVAAAIQEIDIPVADKASLSMARMAGVDPHQVDPPVANLVDDQQASWGDPLRPYLLYARRPSIVLSVRAMWDALGESGLLEPTLYHYRVRRVTLFQEVPWTQSLHVETHGTGLETWSVENGGIDPFAEDLGDRTANIFSYYSGGDPNQLDSAPFTLSVDPADSSIGLVEFFKAPGRHDMFAVPEFYNPDGIWEEAWRVEPVEEAGVVQLNVPLAEGEDDAPSLMRLRLGNFEFIE
jgi:hypothetical protein